MKNIVRHFEIEPSQLGTTKLFDDDNNPLSTRRLGTGGDLINFSLNNKSELNRNIPFSKLKNMDFTGVPKHKIFSPSNSVDITESHKFVVKGV